MEKFLFDSRVRLFVNVASLACFAVGCVLLLSADVNFLLKSLGVMLLAALAADKILFLQMQLIIPFIADDDKEDDTKKK